MKFLLIILGLTLAINLFLATLIVFFERRKPVSTLAWLMVLLFLPILGFILYLFIGQGIKLKKKKVFKEKEEEDWLHNRLIIKKNIKNKKLHLFFHDPEISKYQDMIQLHYANSQSIYTQDNKLKLYLNGEEKFADLLYSLNQASKYIHMEYYIFRNDGIGKQILKVLEEKAAKGVEVRFLYDALGGIQLQSHTFNKLKENGGKVECFFPSWIPYFNLRANYRNHRKICVIDGEEAFLGGINIGDEYIGKSNMGFWRDTHLRISGSAIREIQRQYLLDWKFSSDEDISINKEYFQCSSEQGKVGLQIVSSGPDSKTTAVKDGYFKIISDAKEYVYIQTPYFVPDESITQALKVAALSGIDVRIMIPSKPDHMFVYWASYSYIGELLESGVRFFTYKKGFLHSKVVIADGIVGSVGTANMDIRSFVLNFEVNAFIYDQEFCKKLEKSFTDDIKECREISLSDYESRSREIKFKESIFRLLSPLL